MTEEVTTTENVFEALDLPYHAKAAEIVEHWLNFHSSTIAKGASRAKEPLVSAIAKALEAEREECAKIAETTGGPEQDELKLGHLRQQLSEARGKIEELTSALSDELTDTYGIGYKEAYQGLREISNAKDERIASLEAALDPISGITLGDNFASKITEQEAIDLINETLSARRQVANGTATRGSPDDQL